MDVNVTTTNEQIRKIEDIIDIQKANGNFTMRQVVFDLPIEESPVPVGANVARSLESGLSKSKSNNGDSRKVKKQRSKRHKSPLPDVVSWPSDSDITVLRMKLCLTSKKVKDEVENLMPGDGLHQPDSSSMVNLATLVRQTQSPSKHSFIDEYLLPLNSWEHDHGEDKSAITEDKCQEELINPDGFDVVCSHKENVGNYYKKDGEMYSETSTKSKIARFLRLYFCPCCRCLYKMENMSDDHSTYWEKRKGEIFQ